MSHYMLFVAMPFVVAITASCHKHADEAAANAPALDSSTAIDRSAATEREELNAAIQLLAERFSRAFSSSDLSKTCLKLSEAGVYWRLAVHPEHQNSGAAVTMTSATAWACKSMNSRQCDLLRRRLDDSKMFWLRGRTIEVIDFIPESFSDRLMQFMNGGGDEAWRSQFREEMRRETEAINALTKRIEQERAERRR